MKALSKFLTFFALFSLVACSSDSGNGSTSENQNDSGNIASLEQLPACSDKNYGQVLFVIKEQSDFICKNGKWLIVNEASVKECTADNEGTIWHSTKDDKLYMCEDGEWVNAPSAEESSSSKGSSVVIREEDDGDEEEVKSSSSKKNVVIDEDFDDENVEKSSSSKKTSVSSSSEKTPTSEKSSSSEESCNEGDSYEKDGNTYVCEDGNLVLVLSSSSSSNSESSSSKTESSASEGNASSSSFHAIVRSEDPLQVSKLAGPISSWGFFGYVVPLKISSGNIQTLSIAVLASDILFIGGNTKWTKYGVAIGKYNSEKNEFSENTAVYANEIKSATIVGGSVGVNTMGAFETFTFEKAGTWLADYKNGDVVEVVVNFYAPEAECEIPEVVCEPGTECSAAKQPSCYGVIDYDYYSIQPGAQVFYSPSGKAEDLEELYFLMLGSTSVSPSSTTSTILSMGTYKISCYGLTMNSVEVKETKGVSLEDLCNLADPLSKCKVGESLLYLDFPANITVPQGALVTLGACQNSSEPEIVEPEPTAIACVASENNIVPGESIELSLVGGVFDAADVVWNVDGAEQSEYCGESSIKVTYPKKGFYGAVAVIGEASVKCPGVNVTRMTSTLDCLCEPDEKEIDLAVAKTISWHFNCNTESNYDLFISNSGVSINGNTLTMVAPATAPSPMSITKSTIPKGMFRTVDGEYGNLLCPSVTFYNSVKDPITFKNGHELTLDYGEHYVYNGCQSSIRLTRANNIDDVSFEWTTENASGKIYPVYVNSLYVSDLGLTSSDELIKVTVKGGSVILGCYN